VWQRYLLGTFIRYKSKWTTRLGPVSTLMKTTSDGELPW
jgi:hypothetical protein